MTDLRRLSEDGSELEARLLESASDDAPRRGLDRRIHAALGIGGIAVGATAASTTAAAASKAAPFLVSLGVAKWVTIAAVGAGAVVGIAAVARPGPRSGGEGTRGSDPAGTTVTAEVRSTRPATERVPVVATAAVPSTEPLSLAGPVAIPPGVQGPPALPSVPANAPSFDTTHVSKEPAPAPGVSAEETATPATSGLSSELRLMDAAHVALDSGDTQLALTLLDRRDLEFMHGRLAPEALELRIRAYALRHDDAKVMELGRTFLSLYPDSPLAVRVRSFVRDSERR